MILSKYAKSIFVSLCLTYIACSSDALDLEFDHDIRKFAQTYCFDSLLDDVLSKKSKLSNCDPLYYVNPAQPFHDWFSKYKQKFELNILFLVDDSTNPIAFSFYERIGQLLNYYKTYKQKLKSIRSFENKQAQTDQITKAQTYHYSFDALKYTYAVNKVSCLQVMKEIERHHTCLVSYRTVYQDDLYNVLCCLDCLPSIPEE